MILVFVPVPDIIKLFYELMTQHFSMKMESCYIHCPTDYFEDKFKVFASIFFKTNF